MASVRPLRTLMQATIISKSETRFSSSLNREVYRIEVHHEFANSDETSGSPQMKRGMAHLITAWHHQLRHHCRNELTTARESRQRPAHRHILKHQLNCPRSNCTNVRYILPYCQAIFKRPQSSRTLELEANLAQRPVSARKSNLNHTSQRHACHHIRCIDATTIHAIRDTKTRVPEILCSARACVALTSVPAMHK